MSTPAPPDPQSERIVKSAHFEYRFAEVLTAEQNRIEYERSTDIIDHLCVLRRVLCRRSKEPVPPNTTEGGEWSEVWKETMLEILHKIETLMVEHYGLSRAIGEAYIRRF